MTIDALPPAPIPSPSTPPNAATPLGRFGRFGRLATMAALGFSSGLPYLLLFSTLSAWLTDAHVSRAAVGAFALVRSPFTFKPLWAPLIDRLPLPWLTRRFGQRRGWALATQAALMATLAGIAATDPATHLWWTAAATIATSFASASQDIVLDALRVEYLPEAEQGAGAGAYLAGYRIGLIVAGAGALFLASALSWPVVYLLMAALVAVGMIAILLAREPAHPPRAPYRNAADWARRAVAEPFRLFARRRAWVLLLAFVALYKLGDVYVNVMAMRFYLESGYSKIEIASVTKLLALSAAICGALLGGWVASRIGRVRALFLCGLFMIATNLAYAWLATQGHNLALLGLVVGLEQFAGGMSAAAFTAFLSGLCDDGYSATQYALLSSLATLPLDVLSGASGLLAEHLPWPQYFAASAALGLPGLALLAALVGGRAVPLRPPAKKSGHAPADTLDSPG